MSSEPANRVVGRGKIKKLKIVLTNILPGGTIVELAARTAGNTQIVNQITTNGFEKS